MQTSDYIILKRTNLKVPLKATNGVLNIKSGKKVLLSIPSSIERLFVYWIYGESVEQEIAIWLRECWDKNITPMGIDEIIDSFKKSHPAERIENFPFEDISLYASEEGLELPIPGNHCTISFEDEKEIMSIIYEHKTKALAYLQIWFQNYRRKYGLNYNKYCGDQQDFYLAQSFLQQHGLCTNLMTNEELQKKVQKDHDTGCLIALIVTVVIAIGIYLFWNHYDIFLIGFIWCCIIGGGLYFIFSLFSNFFKQS